MKVADIYQKEVLSVRVDTPVKEVSKIIFGRGVNGVPVIDKNQKVVGFITERDILAALFPSVQEYIEDPVHAANFEEMEEKIIEVLSYPAKKIMNRSVTTVMPDTLLLRAESLMLAKKVGRLPVVNAQGNLVGIIAKGDVFRAVVGEKLPFGGDEQFHDWLSKHYDLIVDWKTRLSKEIPDFVRLFKKEKATKILDVGCGTGFHAIALAEKGFQVVGIDVSKRMIETAQNNLKKSPVSIQKNVKFRNIKYKNLRNELEDTFDAAIFMGSGLAHTENPDLVIKEVNKVLKEKAIVVIQVTNFERVIKTKGRLFDFAIRKSHIAYETEHAFLRFYDPKQNGHYMLNVSVFDKGQRRWSFHGMHSVKIYPLTKQKTTSLLKKNGFTKFIYYGCDKGFYYDNILKKPFNEKTSDVLVVLAKRS